MSRADGSDENGTGCISGNDEPGDQDVLAQQVKLQRGVDRVAVRVEDRSNVQVDAGAVFPHV